MIDFLGNEVHVGDEVVAMVRRGERSKELIRGLVIKITPKRVELYQLGIGERVIDISTINSLKVKQVEHERVVKVNTGNIELV
ncbi:hypothetical protein [Vibrio phage JSF23]|jgi:hypothetical protein|uniref:Uncharacterized protein n=4 Tax=Icepovirus bengalense TaxID=2846603 RepID=A0A076GBA6_9CAUD|nr:hypothetical protein TU12-16_00315 [Vibrio phage ICP2_2006_A]AII27114.1 hypothetical protein ICP22011A_0070 [Vibrio phage ICP2_2011_A]ASV43767.1 hypothetical protein [Vibrio phage JSF23]ASV43793.1 hypothetical protein [Vibrio phage JSF27]QNL29746.1 hypothetical protein Saratov15_00079 [Vibrio phage Saratov-15]WJJ54320.1 hypothetical protein [Vibrio phage JPW]